MTTGVSLHQISVVYDPEQDRLLMRLNLTDLSEFRFWLTRRFVVLIAPHLIKMLHAGIAGNEDQVSAVSSFHHEQVLSRANFHDAFNSAASAYPLGETPVLLAQFKAEPLAGEQHRLTLLPAKGEGINLVVNRNITSLMCKLLEDALTVSEWGLEFHVAAQLSGWDTDIAIPAVTH